MEQIFETQSPEETHALGRRIAKILHRGDCLALVGDLGAGKTAFVRGLAEGLGCDPHLVSSPTYVLVQEYPNPEGPSLFHIDLYRLSEPEAELADLGLEEMLETGVVVIEWADRVERTLPKSYKRLEIQIDGESSRRFILTDNSG
ncbi:MAG: tRNA (adenosine(37)-N6)-threonylcarbamoyltransferase complex ATPase subunit type 1 TsaE [Phycisphaerae bacterium]|nr:tRNA (adenosine(37)-N6)-threonylcarbamoyltransferase complex ATPase subunit type 1 TsaE [Phycisphaerae bacterium]